MTDGVAPRHAPAIGGHRLAARTAGIALAWRALVGAGRTPAVWAAAGAQIALGSLYLLVWGDGIPLVGARPVLEQFATAQWVFLGLALPWAAARSGAAWRSDEVARLAAMSAVPPSSIVGAHVAALTVLLGAVAAAGLPFALLAQRISALPLSELWRTQLPLYALGLCAATASTACTLVVAPRLLAWTASTGLTVAAVMLVPPGLAGGAVLTALGAAAAAVLVTGADQRCRYVSEHV